MRRQSSICLAEIEARRKSLAAFTSKLTRQLDSERTRLLTLEERQTAWTSQWTTALAPLCQTPDVTVEQAREMLDQVSELQTRLKEARETQARLAGLRREAAGFSGEVRDLCRRIAPDSTPPAPSPDYLPTRRSPRSSCALSHRRRDARRQEGLDQAARCRGCAQQADRELEEANLQLAALCREARCDRVDDLPAAEERSRTARELRNQLKLLDEQIEELCGHDPPDQFRRAVLALDLDRLPDRIQALAEEIHQLDQERNELKRFWLPASVRTIFRSTSPSRVALITTPARFTKRF